MTDSRFLHPIHERGVRGGRLPEGHIRGPLTDARIHHYAKLGYYGTENQEAANKKKPKKQQSALARALKLLESLR